MNVRQIMTRKVECVSPETTLQDAAQRMKKLDVGFLPVCEKDRLVGTVTDRDIALRCVAEGKNPAKTTSQAVMTRDVFYCYDDQDVAECGAYMQEKSVRRMLILDRNKRLVGVISLGDIAKAEGEEPVAAKTLKTVLEAA